MNLIFFIVAANYVEKLFFYEKGLVTEVVQRDMTDAVEYEAYLCGSPGMIDATIAVLKGLGMTEENIFYDKFE